MENKWVQVWGQAHSAFSYFYYPSCAKTYRLVMKSAISGKGVRFELSNECAKNDVYIGALSVAKCDEKGRFTGECKTATVNSRRAFCLKEGQVVASDEVSLDIEAEEYFCISVYVEKGALRSGNLLDNAIRACHQYKTTSTEAEIHLTTGVKGEYLIIKCKNSSMKPGDKPDGSGYGLKILKEIALKYQGDFHVEYHERVFEAQIILKYT